MATRRAHGSLRTGPRGGRLLPGRSGRARRAASGSRWPGGVALARVAERRGARLGFGASVAAMLETVAIIGPARFGIPLTQAATAPMLGRLEARGWRPLAADPRLRGDPPAPQHGHHGVLHLGDHRRPRRLRRHLRRDRPPARPGDRHRRRPGAHRWPACSPGRPSRAPCRCWSTAAAWRAGTASPTRRSAER